jgi:hypothetical protein
MDRRARLLRFIAYVGAGRHEYTVRLGDSRLKHDYLSDDGLEALAQLIRRDFWSERKWIAQNRPFYSQRAA